MLEVEEDAHVVAGVVGIDEDRAALEEVAVALLDEVDRRVEQRMARADEGGERRPGTAIRLFSKVMRS